MALKGVKVIELAGLAPAPFCGMILSDYGASVIKIEKPGMSMFIDALMRGKKSIVLDFKSKVGVKVFAKLCASSDVLIEPYRAGVMEKLGLGPSVLCSVNPRLIYARMSGYGHQGPFAKMAGHDINYLALSGVLSLLGHAKQNPLPPINLLGDFAGGGLMCALGITLALLEREKSGKGQIIDANMVEGTAYLSTFLWRTHDPDFPIPIWGRSRGENLLDGGAPFYNTYKTKDGKYMAVGALEPQFYQQLLNGLELDEENFTQIGNWDKTKKVFAEKFASKTQDEWCKIFDHTDACVTPVLSLDEAPSHPHNKARQSFVHNGDKVHPCPAPCLSLTPASANLKIPRIGEHTHEVLTELGYTCGEIQKMKEDGIIECNNTKAQL